MKPCPVAKTGLVALALTLAACAGGASTTPAPTAKPIATAPRPVSAHVPRHPLVGIAPRRPVAHDFFGTHIKDDYEWLEDGKSEEVKSFIAAQKAHARQRLDVPERATVRTRVAQLLSDASPSWYGLHDEGGLLFAMKSAPPKQQPLLVTYGADADPKSERVVCDPNVLDPSGKTAIDFYVASPDKKLVAISLSKDGTESGDLHLFDVATGKEQKDVITRVNGGTAGGSVAWNADASGFFYTRYPRAGERPEADLDFYQQVYFHKLGTPEASDTYAMGKDLPRIAEIELLRSDDGKTILAKVANGDGGEAEHHVFTSNKWVRLTRFEDEVSAAAFAPDGKLYAVAKKNAPRGKVVVFSPPFDTPPAEVVPQGDAVIDDVVVTKGAVYVVEVASGPSRVRRFPIGAKPEPLARENKPPPTPAKKGSPPPTPPKPEPPTTIAPGARGPVSAELPLPPVSSVSGVVRSGDDLFLRVESHREPPAFFKYKAAEHRLVKTALAKKVSFDTSDIEVTRETCFSKDGTKVPMTILETKGRPRDGTTPALLTGYGGFGVSVKPRLKPMFRAWLDRGGIVAEANLRGGGELGEEWHRAGNLARKQNVFDDFAACAQRLFDLKITSAEHLAIHGRSNGGLLMGAVLVQHPEMFRAVVSAVGLYDMLRTELSPNGAFNVTEYGSVKDETLFRALAAYSPLHNVKDGVAYPAILFTTGANDPRVDPYHSRKMAARLQYATSSDRPILLLASDDTGHGGSTPLSLEIEEMTDVLTFLFAELGMKAR
jgi:prolyl oligopeptidase